MYCHGFYEFFSTKLNFPAKHCRGGRLPLRTAGANWMDDHFSSVFRMPPTSHLSCGTLVNSRNKHSGLDRKETSNLKSFPLQYNLESNLSCPRKIAAGVAIWRTPQNQLIVIRPGCLKWNCKWTRKEDTTNADEHRGDRTRANRRAIKCTGPRSHFPSPRFPSSLGLFCVVPSLFLSPQADAFKDL